MTTEGTLTTVREADLPSLLVELPGGPVHYPLAGLEHKIGRDSTNDICIPHEFVSKFHARLIYEETSFTIVDLGSANKTFVNGRPVTEAKVSYGDEIRFASVRCRLLRAESKRLRAEPAVAQGWRPPPGYSGGGRTTSMRQLQVPLWNRFRWYFIVGALVLSAILAASFRSCENVSEASRRGFSSAV